MADPQAQDKICGVWALTMEDRVATKLMANSDRWADDLVKSRDLIDLSMLTDTGALSPQGVAKAKHAYGNSIVSDFHKAKDHLLGRDKRLNSCMVGMGMTMPVEEMRARIERLKLGDETGSKPRASRRLKAKETPPPRQP